MLIHFINILTIVIASFASEYFYAKYNEKKKNKQISQNLVVKDSIRDSLILIFFYIIYMKLF